MSIGKMKLMNKARLEYEKMMEERAMQGDCYKEARERQERDEEVAKVMAKMKDAETVKLKKIHSVHQESALIPKLKKTMERCYVAEFQKSQIEEKLLKEEEERLRKREEAFLSSLDLKNPTDEEMRRQKCLKQEAFKKGLLTQLEENHLAKHMERCRGLETEADILEEVRRQREEDACRRRQKKRQAQVDLMESQRLRHAHMVQEREMTRRCTLACPNRDLVELMRARGGRRVEVDAAKEALKDKMREKLEEIEKEKNLTEIARIQFSFLNNEDIRRMDSFGKMDRKRVEAEKAQKKKEHLQSLKLKQADRDAKREYEMKIEATNQQMMAEMTEKEIQKNRLKEEKNHKYRQQLAEQTREKYHYLQQETLAEIERFRTMQKEQDDFARMEKEELQRIRREMPFQSKFGIHCNQCLDSVFTK